MHGMTELASPAAADGVLRLATGFIFLGIGLYQRGHDLDAQPA